MICCQIDQRVPSLFRLLLTLRFDIFVFAFAFLLPAVLFGGNECNDSFSNRPPIRLPRGVVFPSEGALEEFAFGTGEDDDDEVLDGALALLDDAFALLLLRVFEVLDDEVLAGVVD